MKAFLRAPASFVCLKQPAIHNHVVTNKMLVLVLLLSCFSKQTHETIAIAVNRIGGKSNSGEGGEDPIRWTTLDDADGGVCVYVAVVWGLTALEPPLCEAVLLQTSCGACCE